LEEDETSSRGKRATVKEGKSSKPKWIIIGTATFGLVAAVFIAVAKYYEIHKARAEAARAEAEKARREIRGKPEKEGSPTKRPGKEEEEPPTKRPGKDQAKPAKKPIAVKEIPF
jgi:hypothetical protein